MDGINNSVLIIYAIKITRQDQMGATDRDWSIQAIRLASREIFHRPFA